MRKQRPRRWAKWLVLGGTIVAAVGLGTIWLMFQHIPDWYRPAAIGPERVQAVRDDFVGTFDSLSEGLNQSDRPFEYRFTQDQINAWLASREAMWPGSRKWLPRSMSGPQVILGRDGVRLAVTCRHRGVETVLNARLEAHANADGITVQLVGVSGGSLPLPCSWVKEQLAQVDAGPWPKGERVSGQLGPGPLPALSGLFEGIVFPNDWIWQNGKQPFRVSGLRFEQGVLFVTFERLPRQASRGAGVSRAISPGSRATGTR